MWTNRVSLFSTLLSSWSCLLITLSSLQLLACKKSWDLDSAHQAQSFFKLSTALNLKTTIRRHFTKSQTNQSTKHWSIPSAWIGVPSLWLNPSVSGSEIRQFVPCHHHQQLCISYFLRRFIVQANQVQTFVDYSKADGFFLLSQVFYSALRTQKLA